MIIRKVLDEEVNIIRDLALRIFPHTYANILSDAQLQYMLNKMYSPSSLARQIANQHVFLLAEEKGVYLGYASYELDCNNSGKSKLHKLYILPQTQGKGIGKLLLAEVERAAKEAQSKYLFLNVNRNNKAREFYERLGFYVAGQEDIYIGNGYLMEDFIMEKSLSWEAP